MQLPAPLYCINKTPRAPPRSAPAISATPSSSVVSATELHARIGQRAVDQDAVPGIRHIGELGDVVAAQQLVKLVRPAPGIIRAFGHYYRHLSIGVLNERQPRAGRGRTQPAIFCSDVYAQPPGP